MGPPQQSGYGLELSAALYPKYLSALQFHVPQPTAVISPGPRHVTTPHIFAIESVSLKSGGQFFSSGICIDKFTRTRNVAKNKTNFMANICGVIKMCKHRESNAFGERKLIPRLNSARNGINVRKTSEYV